MNNKYTEFPVIVYESLSPVSSVLSKSRCRIFYKGQNRNATFITDEFAEKLISTLPYTPVKGIYDTFEEDYTDHGVDRQYGRIYGIVPENPNFAWEAHLDEDGVERIYACCDVLIFSALYEEAAKIVGKSQSMELYPPSIKGNWIMIEGKKYYKFEDACFLGLQILGEEVEPCFEGAAFFSLYNQLKDTLQKLEEYGINFQLKNGGKSEMPKIKFKLSDGQKFDAIWCLLNPNFTEEGDWTIEYSICEVFDEYAVVINHNEAQYERVYYTKDDANDSVELGEREKCYYLDVNEQEKAALEALHSVTGTYENININYQELLDAKSENEELINTYEQKKGELENDISTLTMERDQAVTDYSNAQETITSLNQELDSLKQYRLEVENKEKKEIINSYSSLLSEEVLQEYTEEKIATYTVIDLDKELAYELKKTNPSVFSAQGSLIPKEDPNPSGVEAILAKYNKN